jgi:hypothetical protein
VPYVASTNERELGSIARINHRWRGFVDENVGVVKFQGQPPFLLPEAKSSQADVFETSVVVTLYSQVEGQGPGLVSITVQMPPDVALALATQLTHAGLAARARGLHLE